MILFSYIKKKNKFFFSGHLLTNSIDLATKYVDLSTKLDAIVSAHNSLNE